MNKAMQKLLDVSDIEQQQKIAEHAKTSRRQLIHIAKGNRNASASLAIAIEKAAKRVGFTIHREELSAACKGCEFAKACRKGVAK